MPGSVAVSLNTHDKGNTNSTILTPSEFAPCSDTGDRTAAVVILLIDIKDNEHKTAATKRTAFIKLGAEYYYRTLNNYAKIRINICDACTIIDSL
jgi:hypothetical protein